MDKPKITPEIREQLEEEIDTVQVLDAIDHLDRNLPLLPIRLNSWFSPCVGDYDASGFKKCWIARST